MSKRLIKRIQKDIKELYDNPIENVHFKINEDNMCNLQFMVVGPEDTPYEYGYFVFDLNIPDNYPFVPPKVKYLSTNGYLRFHPFLYENGKVCLSLLNTWSGPQWTSVQTLHSILMSIQSILTNTALLDEPGHTKDNEDLVNLYNKIIEFHKFDYLIQYQIKKKVFPDFYDIQLELFHKNYKNILKRINKLIKDLPNIINNLTKTKYSTIYVKCAGKNSNWDANIYFINEKNELHRQLLKKIVLKKNITQKIQLEDDSKYTVKIIDYQIFAPYPFIRMYSNFDYKKISKKLKYLKENL